MSGRFDLVLISTCGWWKKYDSVCFNQVHCRTTNNLVLSRKKVTVLCDQETRTAALAFLWKTRSQTIYIYYHTISYDETTIYTLYNHYADIPTLKRASYSWTSCPMSDVGTSKEEAVVVTVLSGMVSYRWVKTCCFQNRERYLQPLLSVYYADFYCPYGDAIYLEIIVMEHCF